MVVDSCSVVLCLLHELHSPHLAMVFSCFTTVFIEAVLRLADFMYSATEPNLFF